MQRHSETNAGLPLASHTTGRLLKLRSINMASTSRHTIFCFRLVCKRTPSRALGVYLAWLRGRGLTSEAETSTPSCTDTAYERHLLTSISVAKSLALNSPNDWTIHPSYSWPSSCARLLQVRAWLAFDNLSWTSSQAPVIQAMCCKDRSSQQAMYGITACQRHLQSPTGSRALQI